jgi:putative inorganic carbon (HCO3(-)) transporter
MISLVLITLYLTLEILRPEVLLAGVDMPVMLWMAALLVISCPVEVLSAARGLKMYPSTRLAAGLLVVGVLSEMLATVLGMGDLSKVTELAKAVFIYIVLTQTVNTEGRLRYMRLVIVALTVVLAAGGVLFSLNYPVPGYAWEEKMPRIQYTGILKDSNDLGLAYVVAWAILVFAVVNGKGAVRRIMALMCMVPLGWGIFLTGSRGAMLATLATVFMAFRRRMGLVVPGILTVVLLAGMMVGGVGRMGQMNTSEASADERIRSWTQGWYMLRSNPVLGVGPENYKAHNTYAAHSSLVQAGAELGLPGLFCWLGFFYCALAAGWKLPEEETQSPASFMTGQFHCALVGCMVAALFLSRAYVITPYVLVALVLSARECCEPEEEETQTVPVRADFWRLASFQFAVMIFWRFSIRYYVEGL